MSRRGWAIVAIVAGSWFGSVQAARADHLPRWELGAGLFVGELPDYPGSDQLRTRWLPFPYLVYRGDRLKVDADGVRGLLLDRPRLRLDISANGSLAVNSDDNRAREGMPDLDYLFELGPSLQVRFARPEGPGGRWRLDLPLRAVFSTDFGSLAHQGWVFEPNLSYATRVDLGGPRRSRVRAGFGPVFGDARNHAYFYAVDPAFAAPGRPAYQAGSGYAGSRLVVSLGHDLGRHLLLGAFVRYDNLHGAVFEDSPLMRRRDSVMAGVALTWTFAESSELVIHDPDDDAMPGLID